MKFGGSQGGFSESPKDDQKELSLRERRELLHINTQVQSAATRTQEIREGKIESENPSGKEGLKRELYALTTFITESIYPTVERLAKENEGKTPWYEPPDGEKKTFASQSELELRMEQDPVKTFLQVRDSFGALFEMAQEEWMRSVKQEGKSDSLEVRALLRMQSILTATNHPDGTVWKFLRSGGITAGRVAGDIAVGAPIAFYEHTGRAPTAAEYRELLNSGRLLAVDIASMHVYNMANLTDTLKDAPLTEALDRWSPEYDRVLFPAEFFSVSEVSGTDGTHFTLNFAEGLLSTASAKVSSSRPQGLLFSADSDVARFGCPARGAMVAGADGKKISVVDAAFAHTSDVAETFLVPHMEEFVTKTIGIRDEFVARQTGASQV